MYDLYNRVRANDDGDDAVEEEPTEGTLVNQLKRCSCTDCTLLVFTSAPFFVKYGSEFVADAAMLLAPMNPASTGKLRS